MTERPSPTRGRPTTLDRNAVLHTALLHYWDKGPTEVAINEICSLTGASKPGVYRAFGNDDGLKYSVLEAYETLAIQPFLDLMERDQFSAQTIDAIIDFMTQDRATLGIPNGCLFVMMRAQIHRLGPATTSKLDDIRRILLAGFAAWVDRAKTRGEVADNIPTQIAALYLDMQHSGAMRLQKEGAPPDVIAHVLRLALGQLFREPVRTNV